MSTEIVVPSAGESVSSGILASWLKGDGESVSEGDELFELETDKATLAVPSPASGTLRQKAKEGDEVTVGSVIGEIVAGGAPAKSAESAETADKDAASGQEAPNRESAGSGQAVGAAVDGQQKADSGGGASDAQRTPSAAALSSNGTSDPSALSPAVRRVVEENKLDPAAIHGTGRGGRITKEDALRTADEQQRAGRETPAQPQRPAAPQPARPQAAPSTPERHTSERQQRVPMSTIRRKIAEHLVHGKQEAAHLTTFNEVDMSHVMALRSEYKESFEKKHGVKLGFMSFFVKASCEALKELPEINAYLEGDDIIYNNFYDIGVAVSSDRGLVVPVLRDADKISFAEVERQVADKAKRVREKRITLDELSGGTFTITNGGVFGSLLSTPIPNFPQSAILGMHSIQKRPVAVGDEVAIRPMMYVALTYDHRIVDGRGAVTFLVRIKEYVENPERLLLEV